MTKQAVDRSFVEGEKVFARNYAGIGGKWLHRIVISVAQHSLSYANKWISDPS